MRIIVAFAILFGVDGSAWAKPVKSDRRSWSRDSANVVVTINPEARVIASPGAALPPPRPCGSPMELKIKVVNKGFITAPLLASALEDSGRYVDVDMEPQKLNGESEDSRVLRLTPHGPGPADVTIVFTLKSNIKDHGRNNQVHLLLSCLPKPPKP